MRPYIYCLIKHKITNQYILVFNFWLDHNKIGELYIDYNIFTEHIKDIVNSYIIQYQHLNVIFTGDWNEYYLTLKRDHFIDPTYKLVSKTINGMVVKTFSHFKDIAFNDIKEIETEHSMDLIYSNLNSFNYNVGFKNNLSDHKPLTINFNLLNFGYDFDGVIHKQVIPVKPVDNYFNGKMRQRHPIGEFIQRLRTNNINDTDLFTLTFENLQQI